MNRTATLRRSAYLLKGGDTIATTDLTLRRLARTGSIPGRRGEPVIPVEVFDAHPGVPGRTVLRLVVGGEVRSFGVDSDTVVACHTGPSVIE